YGEVQEHLFADHRPVLRIPQLAIHLDREINEKGLLLNKQVHLNPIWA
ncbi:MAG TPA: M18 family aminopeptidase, partial [Acidimicrobiaceae bacterium]|nr:M18 family aminopeptidase [Acidimicrobiaceae bacterium]